MKPIKNIDEYIALASPDARENLEKIRAVIKTAVPDATEVISYAMPAFKLQRVFIFFAAFKNHYSLFIPPNGVFEVFAKELKPYKQSKATLQFPKSQDLPFDLIGRMAKFAAAQQEDS